MFTINRHGVSFQYFI